MNSSIILPQNPAIDIEGSGQKFPIRRIFCVGKNYEAHAQEMGAEVDREAPFYFTKSAWSFLSSGETLPFPPGTDDLHHEIELVVAIGKQGFKINKHDAKDYIFGYATGIDLTRRDLQSKAKEKRRPWCVGKDFEGSAVIGALNHDLAGQVFDDKHIILEVNGEVRQSSTISLMVWKVEDLIADLSRYYTLEPGDLIMTGTPDGVSTLKPGDHVSGAITGLAPVQLTLGELL